LARRLARTYGTRASDVLGGAVTIAELGVQFGGGLSEREVRYLVNEEWACTADDILWRRTKLGLRVDANGRRRLEEWLSENASAVESLAY
jgi:glycerol-3-phosphate dehydrogenase